MSLYTKIFALLMMFAFVIPAQAAVQSFDASSCSVIAAEEDQKKEGDEEPDCE